MREILFRAKREDNGEWVYGDLLQIPKQNFYSIFEQTPFAANYIVLPETVGQYIGLEDKNGKKVFDGDIVRYSYGIRSDRVAVGKIEYDCEDARFFLNSPRFGYLAFDDIRQEATEVIGNIHDNPELIEGENK